MDRTAWIAIILSVVGLLSWQYYVSVHYPPVPAQTAGGGSQSGPVNLTPGQPPAPALAAAPSPAAVVAPAPAVAAMPASDEKFEIIKTDQIELRFTDHGAGIARAIPQGKQHVAEGGRDIELNREGATPIGALSVQPGGAEARAPYQMSRDGEVITFERTGPEGLKVVKRYSLVSAQDGAKQPAIPAVRLDVTFTNTGPQPYQDAGMFVSAGSAGPIHPHDLPTNTAFDWLTGGNYHTTSVTSFDAGHVPLLGIETSPARTAITESLAKAAWVAVKNQFYVTVVAPLPASEDQEPAAREVWARRFDLLRSQDATAQGAPALHGVEAALGLPALKLAPGETKTQSFQIYSGPKFHNRLTQLGHGEEEVMNFGKFKVVSIILLNTMNTLKSWVGNYAIAIILLTILVKLVLLYPQLKANSSMRRMSALAPKMTELREKHKEDPVKMNAETMKLYKDYGVNPLGSCLPTLIQMPIFFGFLYMLGTAAELRNAGFLWVHDLSTPDTVAHLGGIPINILPLLMTGTQFWQMSLMPKTGDPQQQKIFKFMPLIFGFFCYSFAAALALYYTMQGLLTIIQLYATRNQPLPTLQKRDNPPGSGPAGWAARLQKGPDGPGNGRGNSGKRARA